MKDIYVNAPCGQIKGKETDTGYAYLGIPYGKAERFRAPEPVSWDGVRDCTEYGPMCPQPNYRRWKPEGFEYRMLGDEDCQNLNIWTPDTDPAEKLPVAVFIQGGAFQVGSAANSPRWAGDLFMEDDKMVVVTVNFRVGIMGFLELGAVYGEDYRGSGNAGMLDVLQSIRWLRGNISAFGGDPDNITLLGISAGAKIIGALLTLPEVQDCIHSVVMESGAMQALRTVETAEKVTASYMEYLPAGTDLLHAPAADLVEAQAEMCQVIGCTGFYGPVLTAPFRPDWQERWAAGERFTGKAVIGGGKHELVMSANNPEFKNDVDKALTDFFGNGAAIARQKFNELADTGMTETERWSQVLSDFMYRSYSDGLAKKLSVEGNRVWDYSFDYAPGAHGQGFAFLMNTVNPPGRQMEPEQLAEAMGIAAFFRARIREFLVKGEPDPELWQQYGDGNKMIFEKEPHMDYRPDDSITGLPDNVYAL